MEMIKPDKLCTFTLDFTNFFILPTRPDEEIEEEVEKEEVNDAER